MTTIALNRKALYLILAAMNHQIASEEARYKVVDSDEDAAGDFGNDLAYLRMLRDEFAETFAHGPWNSQIWECWQEPGVSLSLLPHGKVAEHRAHGLLAEQAELRYAFPASTYEEAAAIHNLRQGWAPYCPMGAAASCPKCDAKYYPQGSGDCWRCGHLG